MKKILAALFCMTLTAGAFTGCSSKNNGGNGKPSETSGSSGTSSAASESGTPMGDLSDIPGDLLADLSEGMTNLAGVIEGAIEWPAMMIVNDTQMLMDYFTLDKNNPNYKDIMVKQAAMSAAFGEYIVIEAHEGKVDEAVKDLEARKTKLIEKDAFYPEHKELAEKTIVGKSGNFAYLIAGEDPESVETVLRKELEKAPAGENGAVTRAI